MVKRKFYTSMIILVVATLTLVSGTYAWFLVGGFGSLFDLNFEVIEASAGLELRGAGMPSVAANWKDLLERTDFPDTDNALLATDGKYTPVSSVNGLPRSATDNGFIKLSVEDGFFNSSRNATKGVDYNEFSLYIRSTTSDPVDVAMKVSVTGDASVAARVAVTYDGVTTVYAPTGETATNAVVNTFANNAIEDTYPAGTPDQIITSNDAGFIASVLQAQPFSALATDGTLVTPPAGNTSGCIELLDVVAGSDATGSLVTVRIWLEGNDPDCVDITGRSITGKQLDVKINFATIDD